MTEGVSPLMSPGKNYLGRIQGREKCQLEVFSWVTVRDANAILGAELFGLWWGDSGLW